MLGFLRTSRLNTFVTILNLCRLGEGNTETLGSHTGGSWLQTLILLAHLLDLILTVLRTTEGNLEQTLVLQVEKEIIKVLDNLDMVRHLLSRLGEHGGLDRLQESRNVILESRPSHGHLLPGISPDSNILTVLDVSWTNLQSYGDTLQLPVVIFPSLENNI